MSRRMRDAARRPLHGRRVRQRQVPSAMRCETGCGDRCESDAVRHKSLFGDGGCSEDGMAWLREPMQVRCVYSLRIFFRPDLVVFAEQCARSTDAAPGVHMHPRTGGMCRVATA